MTTIDRRGLVVGEHSPTSFADLGPELAWKIPVMAATTANITLSGLQTIDGVALAEGDRVLVKDQSDQTTNGIYDASASTWTRSVDADESSEILTGTQVLVTGGSTNGGVAYRITTVNPITIGASNLVFTGSTSQPLDSDLTAIAALLTTAYGRSLLTLANATALAAEVDGFFLTPSEGNAAYQPLDSDLTSIAALADPNADRILFWDDSAGGWRHLTVGTNLTITGTTLDAANASGVSSIASNTGAFTLSGGITNSTNDIRLDVSFLRGFLSGLNLSKSATTTVGVAAGVAADSTNASLMKLSSAYTKTFSAWAVGSGNGGLDTGSIAALTWYHVWLIMRTDTGVVDVLLSTSATAPTMPTNYTLKRRIGSVKTDVSSNLNGFAHTDDLFVWDVCASDVNTTNPGTAAVTVTLGVPTGIVVEALYSCSFLNGTSNANVLLTALNQTDTTPSATAFSFRAVGGVAGGSTFGAEFHTYTNTSAQIRYRVDASGASDVIKIVTRGWRDTRGK